MYKTKNRPPADAIAMMMRRERIPATVAYEIVEPTPLITDYPFARVLEYKPY